MDWHGWTADAYVGWFLGAGASQWRADVVAVLGVAALVLAAQVGLQVVRRWVKL